MEIVVTAHRLSKTYYPGKQSVEALHEVDLDIASGAFVVLLGPSGSGKSTLLNLIGGISRPSGGALRVCGLDMRRATPVERTRLRRDQIGFIFQFFNLLPSQNILENTALPLLARGQSWSKALSQARVILAQLGLGQRLSHHPAELSGGEQQRVAIARAVVGHPKLLLADEPTGNLGADHTRQIMTLLADLQHELGLTCILATHNPIFTQVASQVIEMYDGAVHPIGAD